MLNSRFEVRKAAALQCCETKESQKAHKHCWNASDIVYGTTKCVVYLFYVYVQGEMYLRSLYVPISVIHDS